MSEPSIDIRPDHWVIVRDILRKHVPQCDVWAFGSRAKWKTKPYSDLDLAVITSKPMSLQVSGALAEDFAESDLPFKVDVVDWATTSASFREIIERDKVVVQEAPKSTKENIASEWEETTLGAKVNLLTGFPFKSERYTDSDDGIKLLRGDNIVQGALRWDGVKKWPLAEREEHELYELSKGDIVLAMDRPWIEAGLKYAAISKYDLPCLLVQRTARLRGGANLDVGFLRYLIGSREFTQHIHAITTGTAVPHISGKQIKNFAFALPPLAEQKSIAAILGALDDKIELNRRMNATLEAMARALFQSWFVDFDPVRAKLDGRPPANLDPATAALFPSTFHESTLGEIPHGWRPGTLGELVELRADRVVATPAKDSTRYIALEDMPSRSIDISNYQLGSAVNSSITAFRKGDVLFGSMRPYFHKVGLASFDGITRTTTFVLRPRKDCFRHFALLQFFSDDVIAYSTTASVGTTIPYVKWDSLRSYGVPIPPDSLLDVFNRTVGLLVHRISAHGEESRTLATLRDTLLPKLLSGKLSVANLESRLHAA